MKVLWITNIMMPPLCEKLGLEVPVVGGWMYNSAKALLDFSSGLHLAIATVYTGKKLQIYDVDGIRYYLLPTSRPNTEYNVKLEKFWKLVNNDLHPDLVHIHGTEFSHGLAFLNACPKVESIVSIQGLVSFCYRYYLAGLTKVEIFKNLTFRDLIRGSVLSDQNRFYKRGKNEKEIIRKIHNVIGRTSWDYAQTWAMNPGANYYFCNETLRPSFYEKTWNYSRCEPYSIFISQAGYPIKGLHQLLKALPLVIRSYPNTKVYIAGTNLLDTASFMKRLRFSGYGKYLRNLIKKNDLIEHVVFLGPLSEEQMCDRYLKSNVFVCPSSIENSPNSLGEAQLLGMPVIASYVGGVPDMMKGYEHWMYRFEDIEILAEKICEVFDLKDYSLFANNLAKSRHDKYNNGKTLFDIYNNILKQL